MNLFIEILVIYVLVVFVLARFVIPRLGFKKTPIPEKLPESLAAKIDEIKNNAISPYQFLELSYEYLGNRHRSERFNTVLKFHYLFKCLEEIWSMKVYIPCSQNNFLLRIFLVRSGFFKEEDIIIKHNFVNLVPHQYLRVRVDNKWLDVDVGERQRGISIGKHLKYFG